MIIILTLPAAVIIERIPLGIIFLPDGTSFHYRKHVFSYISGNSKTLFFYSISLANQPFTTYGLSKFTTCVNKTEVPKCKQTSDTLSMTYLSSVRVRLLRTRHPLYDLSVQCSCSTEDTDIRWWKFVPTLPLKQVTIVQRYVKFVYNPLFFTSLGKSFYEIKLRPADSTVAILFVQFCVCGSKGKILFEVSWINYVVF